MERCGGPKGPTAPVSGDLGSAPPAHGAKAKHDSAVGAQHAHSAHDGDVMNSSEAGYRLPSANVNRSY
jgi:hypothetical protein